jgi:hypothetical protein
MWVPTDGVTNVDWLECQSCIAAGFPLDSRAWRFFPISQCLDRLWSPCNLLSVGYWGLFPHSPPSSARIKNGGAVPPLPATHGQLHLFLKLCCIIKVGCNYILLLVSILQWMLANTLALGTYICMWALLVNRSSDSCVYPASFISCFRIVCVRHMCLYSHKCRDMPFYEHSQVSGVQSALNEHHNVTEH